MVAEAWGCSAGDVDAFRALDVKLRRTANALKGWSMRYVGSVRQQLFMARELVAHLDKAQEYRLLTDSERAFNSVQNARGMLSDWHPWQGRWLANSLGLDSSAKVMRTPSSSTYRACHRRRKIFIAAVQHDGTWFSAKDAKRTSSTPTTMHSWDTISAAALSAPQWPASSA